jgi:DNA-binding XRE family transcriptional regulator
VPKILTQQLKGVDGDSDNQMMRKSYMLEFEFRNENCKNAIIMLATWLKRSSWSTRFELLSSGSYSSDADDNFDLDDFTRLTFYASEKERYEKQINLCNSLTFYLNELKKVNPSESKSKHFYIQQWIDQVVRTYGL